jgi:hypothetical protein
MAGNDSSIARTRGVSTARAMEAAPMRALIGLVGLLTASVALAQNVYATRDFGRFSSEDVLSVQKDNTKLLVDRFQPVVVKRQLKVWDDPSVPSISRMVYVEKLGLVQHLPRTSYFYITDYAALKAFVDIGDVLPQVKTAFAKLYPRDNLKDYVASGTLKIRRMGPLLRIQKGVNIIDFTNIEYYEDSSFFRISNLLDERYLIVQNSWYEHQHYSIYDLDTAAEVFKCLSSPYFSPERNYFVTFGASFFPPKVLQLFSYKAGQLRQLQLREMDVKWNDDVLSVTWNQSSVTLEIGVKNGSDHQTINLSF